MNVDIESDFTTYNAWNAAKNACERRKEQILREMVEIDLGTVGALQEEEIRFLDKARDLIEFQIAELLQPYFEKDDEASGQASA